MDWEIYETNYDCPLHARPTDDALKSSLRQGNDARYPSQAQTFEITGRDSPHRDKQP